MPLIIPTILGPVSELCKTLLVQGAMPGATVEVLSIGTQQRQVAKQKVKGGNARISLLLGQSLRSDDILIAVQTLGSETSDMPSPSLGLAVQPAPQVGDLKYVGFVSHLYQCGKYLWIGGAIPGTTVSVEAGGILLGTAVSHENSTRILLTHPLPHGVISVRQHISAGSGPLTTGVSETLSVRTLSAPKINTPIYGCQTAILVSQVYDGADVTILRDSGITDKVGFDLDTLWFNLHKPLVKGDMLEIKQELAEQCETTGKWSAPKVQVQAPNLSPTPVIVSPLCAGSVSVRIANLIPGSTVQITIEGEIYKGMAPEQSYYDFRIPPLKEGYIYASQTLCGITSATATAMVNSHDENIHRAKLLSPLYACGRVVFVDDVHPGAQLQVWCQNVVTKEEYPLTGFVSIYTTTATIPIAPYLNKDDVIWVAQMACSDVAVKSNKVTVIDHDERFTPVISGPVYSQTSSVHVGNTIAGGWIEVSLSTDNGASWQVVGHGYASPQPYTNIQLNRILALGNLLRVSESLCGNTQLNQKNVPVVRQMPLQPVLDYPTNNAIGVERKPLLTWHDPGSGSDRAASLFNVQVCIYNTQSNPPIMPIYDTGFTITTNSYQIPSDLSSGQVYIWFVGAKNSGGTNLGTSSFFTVTNGSQLVQPILISYDKNTKVLNGKNFLPASDVWVRLVTDGLVTYQDSNGFNTIHDHRETVPYLYFPHAAKENGEISLQIDPMNALPPLLLPDGEIKYGIYEQLYFTAHDTRTGSGIDGFLDSNTLSII